MAQSYYESIWQRWRRDLSILYVIPVYAPGKNKAEDGGRKGDAILRSDPDGLRPRLIFLSFTSLFLPPMLY
jgi:hypothetical protein